LVELMVSMLAGAILALMVGTILIFGYKNWGNNSQSVELQRDASLAMEAVGRLIRQAPVDDDGVSEMHASESGDTLYIDAAGTTNVTWSGDQLILNPSGMVLVRDWVLNFSAGSPRGDNAWDVVLQLYDADSGSEIIMTGTYVPRNVTQ
jgi:type II secretory pathway pseudopilin PulG